MIALGRGLRLLGIAIAVLGVIDPEFTWARTGRPVVALIDATAPRSSQAFDGAAAALARDFDVHRGAVAGAAATVLVGDALPVAPPAPSGALVAFVPAPPSRRVEIASATAPAVASPAARIPVEVAMRAIGAAGRTLRVDVIAGGILLDRVTVGVKTNDEPVRATLSAAALQPGLTSLLIRVRDDATDDPALRAETAAATEVIADRWSVLVVDARPSWMSTFVRRVLEADRRFVVTSRVTTSPGVAAETGAPPTLADAAALDGYAAIVVGAPEALGAAEVRTLERFARGRGGSVVLLMDRLDAGPFARLTGATSWRDVHGIERRAVASTAGTMLATELAVPERLAPGASVLATTGQAAAAVPAVWQVPLGAGRVIVSGALDAWRYRTRERQGFSTFWSHTVGTAAAAAPAPVSVEVERRMVPVGAPLPVRVIVRAAQLSDPTRPSPTVDVRARVSIEGAGAGAGAGGDGEAVSLWPTAERGVFAASVPARQTPGTYRLVAEAVTAEGTAIGAAATRVQVGDLPVVATPLALSSWVTSRGGVVVPVADAAGMASALHARIAATPQPTRVRPMRSPWWLPVLLAALGGEWWLRRRRGER